MRTEARDGDLGPDDVVTLLGAEVLAIDTETSGLRWDTDELRLVQLFAPALDVTYLVRAPRSGSTLLRGVLEDDRRTTLFHHARFDLRFLAAHLGASVPHPRCSKIMSRALWPQPGSRSDHSLEQLVATHLGIALDKGERLSDWGARTLSASQIRYATEDVVHLPLLHERLGRLVVDAGLTDVVEASFAFLPALVALDLRGVADVFAY